MRFAFIDDEQIELDRFSDFANDYSNQYTIPIESEFFCCGEEFLRDFVAFSYDIIFIDIYMGNLGGIKTAKRIREIDTRTMIVFVTSSMEHMPDAFSCHAFDYIEKPITRERFFSVVKDALGLLPKEESSLTFTYNGFDIHIPFFNFEYLLTSGHTTEIVSVGGEHYFPYITYKKITEQLQADNRFLQINKCILVNMDYVVKFEEKNCVMTNGTKLPVNIRNVKAIEQTWRNYIFMKLHKKLEGRSADE